MASNTITKIAHSLNELSNTQGFRIASLPQLRKENLNKNRLPNQIFTDKTIFLKNGDQYAYHYGGRDEIQFNVGEEPFQNPIASRYSLSLSLEPSRSLTDPIKTLKPFFVRLNKCIKKHPESFRDFEIWYHTGFGTNRKKIELNGIRQIPESWFQLYNFICVGNTIDKPIQEINTDDYKTILEGFDKLLPIYEYIVFNRQIENKTKNKIARICWNTNGWIKPSGSNGKAKTNSHEKKHGYGHEEWLFDFDQSIRGYHYGFLEPIGKNYEKYISQKFDILLYTIDGNTKQRYWVGELKNVEVIDEATSEFAFAEYKKRGWFDLMLENLKNQNVNTRNSIEKYSATSVLNVRFRRDEQNIFEKLIPISNQDKRIRSWRYNLLNDSEESLRVEVNDGFDYLSGNYGNTHLSKSSKKNLQTREVELVLNHNIISDEFLSHLRSDLGKEARRECRTTGGARVDIVMETKSGYVFFEIKTYEHLKTSMRNALGQLFEYGCYPDKQNAERFILVSDIAPDQDFIKYLDSLNKKINIPVGYIQFDKDDKQILYKSKEALI